MPDLAPADPDAEEAAKLEALADILEKYFVKIGQERTARLAGEIVAADFYLRQLTYLEVLMDLMGGGFALLQGRRHQGVPIVDIAETPMSWLMGEVRRRKWAELGEPPRPEHPPRARLVDRGGFSTEPLEHMEGSNLESRNRQYAAFKARHEEDAEKQVEWEAEARRDYDRRRASDAGS